MSKQLQTITIQAAGRTFSKKNLERMTALWRQLGDLLVGSKLVGVPELTALLQDAQAGTKESPAEEEEEESESKEEVAAGEIAAGTFIEDVRSITWFDTVNRSLDLFRARFLELHRLNDSNIERRYGVQTSRYTEATRIVDEMAALLKEQCEKFPGVSADVSMGAVPGAYYNDGPYGHLPPLYASAAKEGDLETTDLPVAPSEEKEESVSPSDDSAQSTEIVASQDVDLSLICTTEIAANKGKGNRLPLEGVLFRVEEPSESAPAKGSSLPLYVPREVAELAAIAVNESKGLPLDVDDSLSQHANSHIAGVFVEASVSGNDFIVRGHLFPWSQPEKVKLISANKERLGMSMNAHATGHIDTVDGKKVFHIDSLELLGANILYSDRATYQQTKLLAASAAETQPEITMEIEEQLKKLGETLADISAASRRDSEAMLEMRTEFSELRKQVSEIQAERRQQQEAVQAQSLQAAKQEETQSLISAIAQSIEERLAKQKEELLDLINPSRQPARPSRSNLVSLVASNQGTKEGAVSEKQIHLIQCEAALQELRRSGGDEGRRGELIEEIRALKFELELA